MSSNSECVKEQLPFSIWQRVEFIYRKIIRQHIKAEGITKERLVFNWPSRHNRSLESEWKVSTFICSFSGIFKALILWGLSIYLFFPWKNSTQQELQTDLIRLPSLMHTWKYQEINTYIHTHQSRPAVAMAILSLCVAPSLFAAKKCRTGSIYMHILRALQMSLLWAAGSFFSICHIEKMWTYTKIKNGGTAIDPEKGRMQLLHLPFL